MSPSSSHVQASTKEYSFIVFVLSSIFFLVFAGAVYQQSRLNSSSDAWIVNSYEIMRMEQKVSSYAVDLYNQQQNYILTRKAQYQTNYGQSLKRLNDSYNDLLKETESVPDRHQRVLVIGDAIKQLESACDDNIASARARKLSSPNELMDAQKAASQAMFQVQISHHNFNKSENDILEMRQETARQAQRHYLMTLAIGTVLGLTLLFVVNLVIFLMTRHNARAQKDLQEAQELFSYIMNGINDGLYDHNLLTGKVYYSASYRTLLGYSADEIAGFNEYIYDIMHPEDAPVTRELIRQYMEKEIPTYCHFFRVRHKDGHWVWLMSRCIGIWDKKGNMTRIVGIHVDVTTQKKREEELNFLIQENRYQQAELALAKEKAEMANAAKSEFLAIMSHEIRTPVNAVNSLARLLLGTPLDKRQKELTETLNTNADTLLNLINGLLDLDRLEAGQMSLENRGFTFAPITKTLHAMFDAQTAAKGLTFSISNQLGDACFLGDQQRIQQILINLVGNAVKFTETGSVSVLMEGQQLGDTLQRIVLSVRDTGTGIPPEKIGSIFDKFVQVGRTASHRFGGSGLGLTISQSLARLMGGNIAVESYINRGSIFTFTLTLPVTEAVTRDEIPEVPQQQHPAPGSCVLIVDDYAANIMVASLMLEHMGYSVEVAQSGAEALELIGKRSSPYAAILMDVQMRDMDGFETTKHIREYEQSNKHPRVFIIGVTAHALAGDREQCLAAGMDDYMNKPINPDLLSEKLRQHSASRAAA